MSQLPDKLHKVILDNTGKHIPIYKLTNSRYYRLKRKAELPDKSEDNNEILNLLCEVTYVHREFCDELIAELTQEVKRWSVLKPHNPNLLEAQRLIEEASGLLSKYENIEWDWEPVSLLE